MKLFVILKRLSHPRVKRRLKIGLTVWAVAIILALLGKLCYDIGFFKAQSQVNEKNATASVSRAELTLDAAQRVVTGALKEDPGNPKTRVLQILENNQNTATILIEANQQRQIAWIIAMHLFFVGDLYNDNGYNLTHAFEQQNNIKSQQ